MLNWINESIQADNIGDLRGKDRGLLSIMEAANRFAKEGKGIIDQQQQAEYSVVKETLQKTLAEPVGQPQPQIETRTPEQILNMAGRVRVRAPEGATANFIRVTNAKGQKAEMPLEGKGGLNRGANVLQGAGPWIKAELGNIGRDKKFIPIEGIRVEEIKKEKQADITPQNPYALRGEVELKNVSELRTALREGGLGLSRESQRLIEAFLDSPMAKALDGVRFKIADTLSP